jgi:hypothetical protein
MLEGNNAVVVPAHDEQLIATTLGHPCLLGSTRSTSSTTAHAIHRRAGAATGTRVGVTSAIAASVRDRHRVSPPPRRIDAPRDGGDNDGPGRSRVLTSGRGGEPIRARRTGSSARRELIPRTRYIFANGGCCRLTKIASGYWHVADSQSGAPDLEEMLGASTSTVCT